MFFNNDMTISLSITSVDFGEYRANVFIYRFMISEIMCKLLLHRCFGIFFINVLLFLFLFFSPSFSGEGGGERVPCGSLVLGEPESW